MRECAAYLFWYLPRRRSTLLLPRERVLRVVYWPVIDSGGYLLGTQLQQTQTRGKSNTRAPLTEPRLLERHVCVLSTIDGLAITIDREPQINVITI